MVSASNKNLEKRRSLSLCKRHHSEFMCGSDNSEVVNAISHFNQQQSPKASVKRRSLFYCCSRRRSSSSSHARKRGSTGLEQQQGTRVHIKQETQENLLMQQQQVMEKLCLFFSNEVKKDRWKKPEHCFRERKRTCVFKQKIIGIQPCIWDWLEESEDRAKLWLMIFNLKAFSSYTALPKESSTSGFWHLDS